MARSWRSTGRIAGTGIALLGSLLWATEARAEDTGRDRPTTGNERGTAKIEALPPWSLRLGIGVGAALPSTEEDLLSDEGYSGPRWAFTGEVERRVSGSFGLGARVIYGWRSLDPSLREGATSFTGPAPNASYSERDWIGAVELPFDFVVGRPGGERSGMQMELSLVPWAGVGFGNVDVHGGGSWRAGAAFGGEARLFFRGQHGGAGLAAGAYTLRVPQPSALAGPANLGMILLSAIGGFDVG